jgi:hypothetical protein
MPVTATPIFPQALKRWDASIVNGDAQQWKRLLDVAGIGGGANGSKVSFVGLSSNDSTLRNVQLAVVRGNAVTVTSATPGVITFNNHNMSIGQQFFLTGTAVPTGTTALLPYFVIATGFTANSFQFSATAGGAAINTSSTGTDVILWPVRILTTIPAAITAGTDGATAAPYFFNTTYFPGFPVDNDGSPYILLESGDYLAVSATSTVTANRSISAIAYGGNF